MRCIRTGKSNLEVNKKEMHYEDELVLKDRAGHTIGALGVVFAYKSSIDTAHLIRIAEQTATRCRPGSPTPARCSSPPAKETLIEWLF